MAFEPQTAFPDDTTPAMPVRVVGTAPSTVNLVNGTESSVTGSAAQILAANTSRKRAVIQNTGTANIRVGITGVTTTTGIQLYPGGSMIIEPPLVDYGAIFAIREGSISSTVFVLEEV